MTQITHLIWDCDGCLIDSEVIACRIEAEAITQAGYPLSTEDYIHRFAGVTHKDVRATVVSAAGITEAHYDSFVNRETLHARTGEAFESELKAIDGIHEALASIQLPMAIASGSGPVRLKHSLSLVALYEKFAPHVYSANMVKNGKPAPDVFLLAAQKLGANPQNCLVIEDGHHGVHGAKAAGMYVLGFIGATHGTPELAERLTKAGADQIFSHMSQLPNILQTLVEAPASSTSYKLQATS